MIEEAEGRDLALAHLARTRAAFWVADAAGVIEHSMAAAEIAEHLDDRELQGRALAARHEAESMQGDLPAAVATWERAEATWAVERRDHSYARFLATRALTSYWRGDYETCLTMASEAHRLGDGSVQPRGVGHQRLQRRTGAGRSLAPRGGHLLARPRDPTGSGVGRGSFRFTARAMNMRAGALREIGDLASARLQSEEALELAKDSSFPPAALSARLDLLYADLSAGDVGAAERTIPDLGEALDGAKGFHQFLWSIRLAAARAEAARLAGRHDEAISFAWTALSATERFGRRKYDCLVRVPLARALVATGRPKEAVDVVGRAIVEAERLGHLPSHWLALSALARRKRRSATRPEPTTPASRPCGASRGSPMGWTTSIGRRCAHDRTSRR